MTDEGSMAGAPAEERPAMDSAASFEMLGEAAIYRPSAHGPFGRLKELVFSAISMARERGVRKLLINTCSLSGFGSPGLGERYFFVRECAQRSGGALCLAMVVHAELIDPEKFGVAVARTHGLKAEVFTSEAEALNWLASCKA